MPIDASIPLQFRQPQFDSPVNQLAQVLQIQGAQQANQLNQLKADEYQRGVARSNRLRDFLMGNAGLSDQAIIDRYKSSEFQDEGAKFQEGLLKRQETEAKAQKEKAEAYSKLSAIQRDLAKHVMASPTPEDANAALDAMEHAYKTFGFEAAPIAMQRKLIASYTDPQQFYKWAAGHAVDADKLLPRAFSQDLGGTTQYGTESPLTGQRTVLGTDTKTVTPDAQLQSETTRRGQNMVDQRAKETAALKEQEIKITGGKETFNAATTVRKEFEDRAEVKKFREAMPVLDAAKNAPNTPQGDLQLIYAVGKVLDPTSVVREGEMDMVVRSGTPQQKIEGYLNYIKGGGRIPPSARAALIKALESRTNEYQKDYNEARKSTEALAKKRGLDSAEIFINDRPFSAAPAAAAAVNSKGWKLHTDANGNRAYVSPDGKSFEEVR